MLSPFVSPSCLLSSLSLVSYLLCPLFLGLKCLCPLCSLLGVSFLLWPVSLSPLCLLCSSLWASRLPSLADEPPVSLGGVSRLLSLYSRDKNQLAAKQLKPICLTPLPSATAAVWSAAAVCYVAAVWCCCCLLQEPGGGGGSKGPAGILRPGRSVGVRETEG